MMGAVLWLVVGLTGASRADEAPVAAPLDLTILSLEVLLNVEGILVSRMSRADEDLRSIPRVVPADPAHPGSPGVIVLLQGDRRFDSEVLWATEAGYRVVPREWLTADLACLLHRYTRLRSMKPERGYRQDEVLVLPLRIDNLLDGRAYGGELAVAWQPVPRWRRQAGYSYIHLSLRRHPQSLDLQSETWSGDSPRHQLQLGSYLSLPGHVELDLVGRQVDRLASMGVPSYLTADLRLGWRPVPGLEVSLAGQHLLESPYLEYVSSPPTTLPTQVDAGVYGMLTWSRSP